MGIGTPGDVHEKSNGLEEEEERSIRWGLRFEHRCFESTDFFRDTSCFLISNSLNREYNSLLYSLLLTIFESSITAVLLNTYNPPPNV